MDDTQWNPMSTAPKTGPVVEVRLLHKNGKQYTCHWAYGDGEGLMPPFGPAWFEKVKDRSTGNTMYCREVEGPFVGWRQLNVN